MTRHVTGVDQRHGGSGDPSPFTALGVRRGIEACVKLRLGRASLEGIHVAVQGVGHVGYHLCKELSAAGGPDSRSPTSTRSRRSARSASSAPRWCPSSRSSRSSATCWRRARWARRSTTQSIPRLRTTIIAGAANNQLAEPRHGDDVNARGILYAPDYAINAGGLINVAAEVSGYDAERARARTVSIYDTIHEIAERSMKTGTPTYRVADLMVEEKLARVGRTSQA